MRTCVSVELLWELSVCRPTSRSLLAGGALWWKGAALLCHWLSALWPRVDTTFPCQPFCVPSTLLYDPSAEQMYLPIFILLPSVFN